MSSSSHIFVGKHLDVQSDLKLQSKRFLCYQPLLDNLRTPSLLPNMARQAKSLWSQLLARRHRFGWGWWHWFDKDRKRYSSCIFPWHIFLPLRVTFHSGMNIQVGVWPTFSRCRGWKPQDHLVKHDVPPHRPKPAASGLRWPSATGPPEGGAVVASRWK